MTTEETTKRTYTRRSPEERNLIIDAVEARGPGETIADIATKFGVAEATLNNWLAKIRKGKNGAETRKPPKRAKAATAPVEETLAGVAAEVGRLQSELKRAKNRLIKLAEGA